MTTPTHQTIPAMLVGMNPGDNSNRLVHELRGKVNTLFKSLVRGDEKTFTRTVIESCVENKIPVTLDEHKRSIAVKTVKSCNGNVAMAAKILDVKRQTLDGYLTP